MTFQYAVPDKDLATSNYDSYRRLGGEKEELLHIEGFFGHLCHILAVISNH